MIETIYKSEDSSSGKPDINIRLPKNIKQIGQSDADVSCQIYIEENVLAYIKQKPYRENQVRYGVLLGEKKQGNGYTYIFINGMVEVEEVIEDTIIFSDDVWTGIYDNIRRYYREGMIVGWYASLDYDVTRDMLSIRKLHVDHFAGNNKVFLNINREEDDEAFYIYERNGLDKQPCYHVYFEKSEDFEDYMFASGRKGEAMRDKEPSVKETGKYGIALNNSNSNNSGVKDKGVIDRLSKEGQKLSSGSFGRVASFAAIITLVGALAITGHNGGLDALGNRVKGFVSGILGSNDNEPDMDKIIQVDGNPINQSTSGNEEATTLDSSNSENTTSENTTSENSSEENTTEENVSANATEDNPESTSDKGSEDEETQTTTLNNSETSSEKSTKEEETTENTHATISDNKSTYASYVVKNGETLYSIAMLFYGTSDMIDEIMELNNMEDENYVMEGQKILLP